MQVVQKSYVLLFVFMAILLRLLLATLGYNYDVESYQRVADIVERGDMVYAETSRYNYAPLWFYLLGALQSIQHFFGSTDIQVFHLYVAGFLALVDVGIWAALRRWYSPLVGWLFLFNPVSILITGFHSQMDNLAVLWAMMAWWVLLQKPDKYRLSALLLGISLLQKHILFFFPIWVFFGKILPTWRQRFEFCAISYGIFFLSFAPFWGDEAARAGILKNVFQYTSSDGIALIPYLGKLVLPLATWEYWLDKQVFKYLFIGSLLILGIWASQKMPKVAFPLYLVAMVVLASAMTTQYLAIPLVVLASQYKNPFAWCYTITASLFLILRSPTNLGGLEYMQTIYNMFPFHIVINAALSLYACQFWLACFGVYYFFQKKQERLDIYPS